MSPPRSISILQWINISYSSRLTHPSNWQKKKKIHRAKLIRTRIRVRIVFILPKSFLIPSGTSSHAHIHTIINFINQFSFDLIFIFNKTNSLLRGTDTEFVFMYYYFIRPNCTILRARFCRCSKKNGSIYFVCRASNTRIIVWICVFNLHWYGQRPQKLHHGFQNRTHTTHTHTLNARTQHTWPLAILLDEIYCERQNPHSSNNAKHSHTHRHHRTGATICMCISSNNKRTIKICNIT